MKQGRFYVASALALSLYSLSGCQDENGEGGAGEVSTGTNDPGAGIGDWGDENKYPEPGGAYHTLVAASSTPVFMNGVLQIVSAQTEVLVISKRAVDSAILVNGRATAATSTTMKKLTIATTTGDQTIVLDFLGGVFGAGTASARGIEVNLGTGTADSLRIRGSTAADAFTVGTDGIAINNDNFRDIEVAWTSIDSTSFALAGGNDSLIATAGAKGVAGNANVPLSIYGGDGNDILTGGDGSDSIYGGAGNDTLTGGGNGTYTGNVAAETDTIAGEAGADTITQGADNNGPDRIYCGTEAVVDPLLPVNDTVTYALRGTADARPAAPATLMAVQAADGERLTITVGGADACAFTTDTACGACTVTATGASTCAAVDGNGLPQYPSTFATTENNDGQIVESGGTVNGKFNDTTKTALEKDLIAPDCEIVIGGMDNDTITGDANANTLYGGPGDDTLTGGAGKDVLYGDTGDDTLNESTAVDGAGADVLNGGAGTDTVTYAARSTTLTVTMDGSAADDGEGSEGDNIKSDVENLTAGSGNDTITGNALNNKLTGGAGNDTLNGGAGDDTFDESGATGPNGGDVFNGGTGTDLVDYSLRTGALTVTMDGVAANDGELGENDNVAADIENLNGGDYGDNNTSTSGDTITGNALNNVINGGEGIDTLYGLAGDDTLDGEGDTGTMAIPGVNDGGEGGADVCINQFSQMPPHRVACEL